MTPAKRESGSKGAADRSAAVVVVFSLLLAMGLRFAPVAEAHFPLNDGGLFYTFIGDIVRNGLGLPDFSTYNAARIPLAYPPLAFLAVAGMHMALHLDTLDLLQWLPAVFSVAAIPAFYWLARQFAPSARQAALAALVFSLMPRTWDWLIMGGGITRSMGLLLALLAIAQASRAFGGRSRRDVLLLIIWSGLLVLTHPEASVHTAISILIILFRQERNWAGLGKAIFVGTGVLLVSAPWWGSVALRHGLDPFLAAAAAARADSYGLLAGLLALLRFQFTDEPFLALLGALGFIGMVALLARRSYLLPLWFLALHTLEPRGGTLFMMIPLALAAAHGLDEVILPLCGGAQKYPFPEPGREWLPRLLTGTGLRIAFCLLILYGSLTAYAVGRRIRQDMTLGSDDLRAFAWVVDNTPADARFVLVTQGLPLRDASSEWFPALTGRVSLATVFGMEWINSPNFSESVAKYTALQECSFKGSDCLDAWGALYGLEADYVYIRPSGASEVLSLADSLRRASGLELAYANPRVSIFRRR